MMVFRLSFFGAFFVDGSMFLIQLLLFEVIYGQTGGIAGWSRGEMVVFIGTFSLVNALNMTVYFFGLNGLPRKILQGDLDLYLTKPGSPLLRLSFESVDPGSLPLVALSLAIVGYGASMLASPPTPGAVLLFALLVLSMTVLWYDMMLIVRTLPFHFLSAGNIQDLEGTLIELCLKVPGAWFQGFLKILFYFVLPYGIMGTLPAQALARTLSPTGFLAGIGVTAVFSGLAALCWKVGLRRYKSPGS